MDRLTEKNEMFMKLGAFFRPLQDLVAHPELFDEQEAAEVYARFSAEVEPLKNAFFLFCMGQPGHVYEIQSRQFAIALAVLELNVIDHFNEREALKDRLPERINTMQAAVSQVPVPRTSVIMEAGSPFTTYCKLRQLCEAEATKSLAWHDAYLSASVFHRYLTAVRPDVPVTLVTEEPRANDNRGQRRWAELMDVSKLYAIERGPNLYRLVKVASVHDRWIVFDTKRIYHTGGSVKDAGDKDYFTISSIEASPQNLKIISDAEVNGTELFGPNTPTHL